MSFKDIKNNKTHKFVGFEPMRLDFKSNSLSKSELQLRVFWNSFIIKEHLKNIYIIQKISDLLAETMSLRLIGQDGEIRTHDLLNPGKSWKIRTFI